MTRLNNHIVDWQSIDEIIEEFARWDVTADFMKPSSKKVRSKTLSVKKRKSQGGASKSKIKMKRGGSEGGSQRGGLNKQSKRSQRSKQNSPYRVVKGGEDSFRTLPRTKSAEDKEFDAMRARSSSLKRQKRLKRKHSAETMQKFFRKKQAQKRVAERRRLKGGTR